MTELWIVKYPIIVAVVRGRRGATMISDISAITDRNDPVRYCSIRDQTKPGKNKARYTL
jgi:hypothetical protein